MKNYVIVDLEMCNVSQGHKRDVYPWKNEVIQIGAVLVNESLEIVGEFQTLVMPEYGAIDTFIERLTGISRKDVTGAPRFAQAIEMFLEWLPVDAILVSWSDNDQRQLRREMESKGVSSDRMNGYFETWLDIQQTFGERMEAHKLYKLSEALIIADVDFESGEHDALVDAKNTALLFIKLQSETELKLNPYYTTQTVTTAYNPFAVLLGNYDWAG